MDTGDLTSDLRLAAIDPFWSFDGRRIAFFKSALRIVHGPQELWIMASNGSQKVHLPGGSGVANIHPAIGRVADSDGDGTPDYLESGSVGRPALQAPAPRAHAGQRFTLRFCWRHPVRWRLLRSELLAVTLGRTPVGLVRFDVHSRLFFIWDSARGGYGAHGRAGRRRTLRAGALSLDLRHARVIKANRRKLTLELALTFDRHARGRTLGLEARADDARGNSQQDRRTRARISVTRWWSLRRPRRRPARARPRVRSRPWPAASGCRTRACRSMIGSSASPLVVSRYSTRGGTSGNVWRSTMPSSSSARRRSERVRGLIPSSERSSSQKRERPSARSRITSIVHFEQTTSAVRQTGQASLLAFDISNRLAQSFRK